MKIGILGYGSIGKRHGENFRSLGHDVAFFDPARPMPHVGEVSYHDRNQLIFDSDAMIIASPTPEHYYDIIDCSRSRKPMFVEKPITFGEMLCSPNDGMGLAASYVKMVGYNLRFHACVDWVGERLDKMGPLKWAKFIVHQPTAKPSYLADGVLFNYSHEIDLALYLLGPATVSRVNVNTPTESDIVLWHHETRCSSEVSMNCTFERKTREFQIHGDEGAIFADLLGRSTVVFDREPRAVWSWKATDSFEKNYISEARAFLARLNGEVTQGCSAEEAIEVVKICNTVRNWRGNAAASGGEAKMEGPA